MLARPVRIAVLSVLLLGSLPRSAGGQAPPPDGMDIQTFNAAVGRYVYITQHGAQVPGHLDFGVGVLFNYQRNPFTVYNVDGSGDPGSVRSRVVQDYLSGELYGYLGIYRYVAIGLSMPLALYMSGTTLTETGEPAVGGDLSAFAWGDVAVHLKGKFLELKSGLLLGAVLTVTAPTGRYADHFVGEESATFRPRFILEYRHRQFSAAVNLGGVFRIKEASFYNDNFRLGQQFTYGVGLAIQPAKKVPFKILAELYGRSDFTTAVDRNPIETGLGLSYRLPRGVELLAGGSAGVLAGLGTPDFRVFLGIRWAPSFVDTDKDGVVDERDKCPGQREDRDGFQDDDGCPDPDNDGDSIPDTKDKCPNKKEDFDSFQDDDGCPDLDNDGDGVPDKQDRCPSHKGKAQHKGCPPHMADDDRDGVANSRDRCPKEREDKDGFQDDDGCPDLDNDKDGLPDEHDKCPNAAEDKDGVQDGDGCPDPDDDGDGVCDAHPAVQKDLARFKGQCIGRDLCPKRAETINGRKDTDGCPDRGKPGVILSSKGGKGYLGRFLTPQVGTWFRGNSAKLTSAARRTLAQLAMLLRLKKYRVLRKIVVMGFIDPYAGAARGRKISQAWANAARSYLVNAGIAAERLSAVGAGSVKRVCRGRSWRCRRRNRRVEFYITIIGK